MGEQFKTPIGRVAYCSLFEARTFMGRTGYELTLIFPPDTDLSGLKKACEVAAKEKFGDKGKRAKMPYGPASEKIDIDGLDLSGWTRVVMRSPRRPVVLSRRLEELTESSGEIYRGVWVRASCDAFGYDVDGVKGVSLGLGNVQKVRDDETLGAGGGTRSADDARSEFDDQADLGEDSSENLTGDEGWE